MDQSNDRGQTLDNNHLKHTPCAGPDGPSISAELEAEAYRPPASGLDSEDRREAFLAMVLHELRNPLGAILTATDLVRNAEDWLPLLHVARFGRCQVRVACSLSPLLLEPSRRDPGGPAHPQGTRRNRPAGRQNVSFLV
jgi:signal transduction histidine kinase